MTLRALILASVAVLPLPGQALTLDFPGAAALVNQQQEKSGTYEMPVGPWRDGAIDVLDAQGEVDRQAWTLPNSGLTTEQMLQPLKKQLLADGFDVMFECATAACGGFDFRYNTEVLPEPEMHVDLGDFRFLSAKRGADMDAIPGAGEYVTLMVSRGNNAGYVQIIHVGPADVTAIKLVASTKNPAADTVSKLTTTEADCAQALEKKGSYILEDLSFKTGSSTLSDQKFASLQSLATYLKEHPDRTVMLVGHTDAKGSLAGNIALSKKRAAAVAKRLVSEYGVKSAQLSAQGMGFLAPRASNLTDDGRTRNRRVEVILTSTQ